MIEGTVKNKKFQKFISLVLCMAMLLPSAYVFLQPQKTEAAGFPTFDAIGSALSGVGNAFLSAGKLAWNQIAKIDYWKLAKETAAEALKVVARKVLAEMTKSTVTWINTGNFGKPFFIENQDSFFRDVNKTQIKDLISLTGYNTDQYPFARSYWLGVIDRYKQQLGYNMQESLSRVTNDPYTYRNDFTVSGWEGLVNITRYPENNGIGFNITADDTLALKLGAETKKITDKVDQGMGFLSMETCPSNPALNARNPYTVQPFDPSKATVPYTQTQIDTASTSMSLMMKSSNRNAIDVARRTYDAANTCPGGWQVATPGAVAANEIIGALDIPEQHAWISSALGNSLTSIFDSLANKFLGKGLRYLSKQISNTPPPDTFNYYGATLDDSTTGQAGWNTTLDEVVDLDTFKKQVSGKTQITDPVTGAITREDIGDTSATTGGTYVPGAIINTALELRIIDSTQPSNLNPQIKATLDKIRDVTTGNNPGLLQIIDRTWPVAYSLDQCIPGPDKGWEKRLEQERDIVVNKLISETASDEQLKVRASNIALRDLRFAVQGFKDWIQVKMFSTIPNSALYIDSVNSMDDTAQELDEFTKKRIEKITAVARLQSIESQLAAITTKPQPNTPQEKQLINIWKQYNAASPNIANQTSLEELQAQLDLASEKLAELRGYENDCMQERAAAGWTGAGGANSQNLSLAGGTYTEYKLSASDNPTVTPFPYPNTGSELQQFCLIPIISGYTHGSAVLADKAMRGVNGDPSYSSSDGSAPDDWVRFRNGSAVNAGAPVNAFDSGLPGYQDLPMVNAQNIYGDQTDKMDIVDVDLNCEYIFESKINDYKHAGDEDF